MYHDGINFEILRFVGMYNDKSFTIEVSPTYKKNKKRRTIAVRTELGFKKYSTDVLGNVYEVKENKLKLEFE
ncbi:hypothetical protein [Floccifex porci]|uniref:hypothetical protein n=1 Tax=Floccifex porci TaxID=2606629 RepID=UPI00197E3692|nr:hypothetical protein [Floccifex porci]